jgi:putative colanic acid biosynthesis glycosyltransferase
MNPSDSAHRPARKSDGSCPLLSIITVAKNDADRLSKTVTSLNLYFEDERYEHLVIDGGSSDRTHEVVASLAHIGNFCFESGVDAGIYDAMNRGVRRCSGEFVLFLNCGDCMVADPDELAHYLESIPDRPLVDIVCFPFKEIDNGRTRLVAVQSVRPHNMPTSHQGMVFSTAFLRLQGFNIRYRVAADYDLYLRARRAGILVVPIMMPLSIVEVDGVASGNPARSYMECLTIAFRNLRGMERAVNVFRIGFRASLIICLKGIIPHRWVRNLRRVGWGR